MTKNVQAMKSIMIGEQADDPTGEQQQQLANEIYATDVIQLTISQIGKLDFEVNIILFYYFIIFFKKKNKKTNKHEYFEQKKTWINNK